MTGREEGGAGVVDGCMWPYTAAADGSWEQVLPIPVPRLIVRWSPLVRFGDVMVADPDMHPINLRRRGRWANPPDFRNARYLLVAMDSIGQMILNAARATVAASVPEPSQRPIVSGFAIGFAQGWLTYPLDGEPRKPPAA